MKNRKRKGFTLIELMIVIAIIIILAAIAIPNYLRMTDRARRSRVAGDFVALATANEAYLVDWGYYPMGTAITDEEFGKGIDPTAGEYVNEITGGPGAAHNISSNTTLTGEDGGIEYIKPATVASMYNPFMPNEGYYYSCTENGKHWVLYVPLEGTTAGEVTTYTKFLYRTDLVTDLDESTSTPAPPEE